MSLSHLLFAIAFCISVFIANAYIYRQFFRVIFPNHKKLSLAICVFLFVCNVVFLFSMRANFMPELIYTILAALLGFSFFFFLVAIVFDITRHLIIRFAKVQNYSESRRKTLKFLFDLGFLFIAFTCFFQGVYKAIRIPPFRFIKLNKGLNYKIAMISDVHLGKNLHKDFLEGLIAKINSQNPDAVVIVGDLIDTDISEIDYLHLLNNFNTKDGVFYVTGNHEYYHDADKILAELKKTNIKIMDNQTIKLDKISISGLPDLKSIKYGYAIDLNKLKNNINKERFNVLLAHQPVMAKKFDLSAFDLVLAGHTHAGQIFPFSILVYLQQGFLHGLYKIAKNTSMYVSSGAGFWGPSIRFLAPSEIVIINL